MLKSVNYTHSFEFYVIIEAIYNVYINITTDDNCFFDSYICCCVHRAKAAL